MKIGLYKLESPNVANAEIEKFNDELIDKIVAAGAGASAASASGAQATNNTVANDGASVANVSNNGLITLISDNKIEGYNPLFIFVSGGGTETQFKKVLGNYRGKIYIIATTINNSLAAAMEILSYLHSKNMRSEIIHGDAATITKRINDIMAVQRTMAYMQQAKFARVGKPSDWLIASDVNADWLQNKIGTKIVDISIKEFIREIKRNKYEDDEYTAKFKALKFDEQEKEKALCVYGALKRLVAKYELNGLTVRCFDLLDAVHTTSCAALALLNAQGIL